MVSAFNPSCLIFGYIMIDDNVGSIAPASRIGGTPLVLLFTALYQQYQAVEFVFTISITAAWQPAQGTLGDGDAKLLRHHQGVRHSTRL